MSVVQGTALISGAVAFLKLLCYKWNFRTHILRRLLKTALECYVSYNLRRFLVKNRLNFQNKKKNKTAQPRSLFTSLLRTPFFEP